MRSGLELDACTAATTAVRATCFALAIAWVQPGRAAAAPAEELYAVEPGPPLEAVKLQAPVHGVLERRTTADERGYYGTVLARFEAALNRAARPTGYACGFEPAPPPAELARTTEKGWSPVSWHDARVRCQRAGSVDVHLTVDLDSWRQQPRWCLPRLGPAAGVHRCNSDPEVGMTSLLFGDVRMPVTAEQPPSVLPGPATLRSIELVAEDGAGAAGWFLGQLEPAALVDLVRAPPALPRRRGVPAAGPVLSAAERAQARAAIYDAVLHELEPGVAVLAAQRPSSSLPAQLQQAMARLAPDIAPSVFADFKAAAAADTSFAADAGLPATVVGQRELAELFRPDGGEDGWARLRRRFPQARKLVTLSAVGLSSDGGSAMLEVRVQGGPLAGSSDLWFLTREPRGWRLAYRYSRAVS